MLFFRTNNIYTDCIPIKDIRPNLKNINVVFIILEVGNATVTKENRVVRTFKVGDPTACVNVSIWDEPGNLLVPGDIVRLTKGYASIWRNCLTLYSGKNGEINKIGEFCMNFNEHLNLSEPNPNLAAATNPLTQKNQNAPPSTLINNVTIANNNGNSIITTPPTTTIPTTTATGTSSSNATTGKTTGSNRATANEQNKTNKANVRGVRSSRR